MEIFLGLAMLGWLYSNIYYTIKINKLKKQNKEFFNRLKDLENQTMLEAFHQNRVMELRNRIK